MSTEGAREQWLILARGRGPRRLAAAMFLAIGMALPATGPGPRGAEPLPPMETALKVEMLRLMQAEILPDPQGERFRASLLGYYEEPANRPLWLSAGRRFALLNDIAAAGREGLVPGDYPLGELRESVEETLGERDLMRLAYRELLFSSAFLHFAADLKTGRIAPRKRTPNLFVETKSFDAAAALEWLAETHEPSFLRRWTTQNPEYWALRSVLSAYREIESEGGWGWVPDGETLRPGMTDPRVAALRRRLTASRDISIPVAEPELYDPALALAVESFQRRHGLEPDGLVGKNTLATLNVPVEERLRQIIVNMERWRWLPENLDQRYVMVNIAGFELTVVEYGSVVERMAVVVGQPYRKTPVFSDRIRYLEFNPYWTVPFSIATKDKLPAIKKDPGILRAQGFEVFRDGSQVSLDSIDWSTVTARTFPYTLRQKPGTMNALGRVKFMFPNRFNVYLHDTPSRELFDRAYRAFSSGCIRLGRPLDLAALLLADSPGWSPARIETVVASGKHTVVTLDEPMPVHLTYSTVWSGEGGTMNFRQDIYGRDDQLFKALFPG